MSLLEKPARSWPLSQMLLNKAGNGSVSWTVHSSKSGHSESAPKSWLQWGVILLWLSTCAHLHQRSSLLGFFRLYLKSCLQAAVKAVIITVRAMIQLPSTYRIPHGQPTICLQISLAPCLSPRSLQWLIPQSLWQELLSSLPWSEPGRPLQEGGWAANPLATDLVWFK